MFLLLVLTLVTYSEARKSYDISPAEVDSHSDSFDHQPFGHVYKPGFNPRERGSRAGLDEEFRKATEKPNLYLQRYDPPKGFGNPRDEYEYYRKLAEETAEKKNATKRMWFDLPQLQETAFSPSRDRIKKPRQNPRNKFQEPLNQGPKEQYFDQHSFRLSSDTNVQAGQDTMNWTTCDEFGRGASFHPQDIIDIDWVPIYIWSTRTTEIAVVTTFTYPFRKFVDAFKAEMTPHIPITIDWEQPKLLMNNWMKTLLIAADRKGLFYSIPVQELSDYAKRNKSPVRLGSLRIKIEDPYLVLMLCGEKYASLMAVSGKEPPDDKEKTLEAETIEFIGTGRPVSRVRELEIAYAKSEKMALAREKKLKNIKILADPDYEMFNV